MASSPAELQEILDGPSLPAPSGVGYNFVNPSNINTACFAALGVCLSAATIAVCIRIYTKWKILRNFNWEDYTLALGFAFFVAYTAVAIKTVFVGAGTHQWDIQVKNIGTLLYWINIEEILYSFAIPAVKISILLQYLRVFTQVNKASTMYIGCWAILLSMSIFYIVALFFQIFACIPRKKYWDPLITTGHCSNTEVLNIATGAFNVLTDIIMVLLPQREIWRLQMSPKRKAAVSAVFFTALSAVVASAFRLYYSVRLEQTSDVSYYIALVGIWTIAENSIGIVCCCLPVLPKFFRVFVPRLVSWYNSSVSTGTRPKPSSNISRTSRTHSTRAKKSNSTWNTSTGPQNQAHGMYETLEDGCELLRIGTKGGDISTATIGEPPIHGLSDSGGIRKIQTFGIESSPALSENVDLEGQKRFEYARMGW